MLFSHLQSENNKSLPLLQMPRRSVPLIASVC